ncbi:hypothetical protein HUG15_05085 [Salicibibacter cibarius]|uniref:Type II toxin-antitoxin system RelE/ParE family toxin n=1 Tax=Salicibibacter cibarius TaxID=2743000 RepID=A0A7T6Z1M3_9BACI|nr:hypothetical protein [Salicibibacter cibarius]QQK75036.1 hypothetical protein HUG15_05085 [Salicibibacter cibarius]
MEIKSNNDYEVIWIDRARIKLAEMSKFNIDPNLVFRRSLSLLSKDPKKVAYDLVNTDNDVGYEFNGYYWILINNVIVIYEVLDNENKVLVDASFFANTAWAHYVFWHIEPEDWDDIKF